MQNGSEVKLIDIIEDTKSRQQGGDKNQCNRHQRLDGIFLKRQSCIQLGKALSDTANKPAYKKGAKAIGDQG